MKKPKFKSSDWIVFNGLVLFIEDVVQGYYRTISIGGIPNSYDWDIDNVARLWTIQDAKEGDILVANIHHWEIGGNIENFQVRVPTIFIYRETKTDNKNVHVYASLFDNTTLDIYKSMYYIDNYGIKDIHPATKEQKELIFNKIRESGWYFNTEKKQLIKIENHK